MDQIGAKQSLASVDDLEAQGLPARPGVGLFLDAGRSLRGGDPGGVDRFGLCADPCPVKRFGEGDLQLPEELPNLFP